MAPAQGPVAAPPGGPTQPDPLDPHAVGTGSSDAHGTDSTGGPNGAWAGHSLGPIAAALRGDVRVVFEAAAQAGVRAEVLACAARRVQALLRP